MKNTLLLSSSYEVIGFIPLKKVIKHLCNNKVEVISYWDESIPMINGENVLPSIVRLKKHFYRRTYINTNFSRNEMIQRDNSTCQYCGLFLPLKEVTVDHVVPKFLGGKTSYTNCVTCCKACNSKKANKTLEQCGMKLLKSPTYPSNNRISFKSKNWHPDWNNFIYY